MRRVSVFALVVLIVVGGIAAAIYWMDRTSYVNTPNLPLQDPKAVGASANSKEIPVNGGPVLLQDEQGSTMESSSAERVPVPFFWMAMGALCAAVGILIATRDRGNRGRYMFRR